MKSLFILSVVSYLLLAPTVSGEEPDTPSMAFLAVDDVASKWVTLFEGTRETDGSLLLDRGATDALLKERSILLQATGADEERIDLRQWVSADLLVVVETVEGGDDPGESDLVWFRALDVVTGVRLVDEIVAVNLKRTEDGLDAIDELLREHILPSWRTLWGKEKKFAGVSLLDIRLVDAGTEDRQTFATLYRLLQRMILHDPSMVLLERNLLDVLVAEEALSPTLQLNLQAGVVLLSGSVHQETEGAVFTLRGTTPSNQNVFEETFLLDGSMGPADLAERILEQLARYFKTPKTNRSTNLRREAKQFHQLATYYHANTNPDRALDAANTAQALAPDEPRYARSLYFIYYEQIMAEARNLKNPEKEDLGNLLRKMRHLYQYQTTIAQYPFDARSGRNLIQLVNTQFGSLISSDPELLAGWQRITDSYHRSLENVYQRETGLSNGISESERDSHLRSLIFTHRPLTLEHFKLLFGVHPRSGKRYWEEPVSREDLMELVRITKTRPYMSGNYFRKNTAPFDPERDDLYIRNLVLSALSHLADQPSTSYEQCALLILQNPLLFSRNLFHLVLNTPIEYRDSLRKEFQKLRREIENEGWFVPELYYLDRWDMKPEMLKKAQDPSLRLVSIAGKPGQYLSRDQELSLRLNNWHDPATGARESIELPVADNNLPDYEDIVTDWRRAGGRDWQAKVWGGRLVAKVQTKPSDLYARETLEVYEKTTDAVRKVKTVQFKQSGVEKKIDEYNDKIFYQALLGGKRYLYFSHEHRLYQFDENMNQVRVLNLAEWGFPDHMAANLLETPKGVFLVLTKRRLHKQFSETGQYSGGRRKNSGGVLVLASDQLEVMEVIANIERPEPRNALEASGPFGARSFYQDRDGKVQLAAYRHEKGTSSWFEIGEDLVPRKRKYPSNAETLEAWISTFENREDRDLAFMKSFCLNRGKAFGLRNRYLPGMRMDNSFEFRRIVPFGKGLVLMNDGRGGPSSTLSGGLYYIPNPLQTGDPHLLMKFTGKELFDSLILWGEDLVLTGRNPQHRIIRKEHIDNYLSPTGRSKPESGPFPDKAYLAAQKAFQQSYRTRVEGYTAPDVTGEESRAADLLVNVPGAVFPLHPRNGAPDVVPEVTFPDFLMSETLVTYEEFFRVYKWAIHRGYRFSSSVDFNQALDKLAALPTRPATDMAIVDAMLYCNARSEMEGLTPAYYVDVEHQTILRNAKNTNTYNKHWKNEHVDWDAGYRLPTEAEWEYVARATDPAHTSRYPWGNTISHDHANYLASDFHAFDLSSGGIHPDVAGQDPPISPVKTFPPQGFENRFYGLAGNVAEIVWDRREWEEETDETEETKRPRRPMRYKGGSWAMTADACTIRSSLPLKLDTVRNHGFRVVLPGK